MACRVVMRCAGWVSAFDGGEILSSALIREAIDGFTGGQRDLKQVQAAMNTWHEQSGKPSPSAKCWPLAYRSLGIALASLIGGFPHRQIP